MRQDKNANIAVRLSDSEKEWIEKVAYSNGRTVSGEVRFRLRKQREQEQSLQQESQQ